MQLRYYLLFILFLGFTVAASAQSLSDIDFQTVKVDNLSEQQIQRIKQEAQSRGLSADQVVQLAVAQGLPQSEAAKLRQRLSQVGGGGTGTGQQGVGGISRLRYAQPDTARAGEFDSLMGVNTAEDSLRFYQNMEYIKYQTRQDSIQLARQKLRSKIFGFELFNRQETASFEPILNIPTPENYQIGPGDELFIDIWGAAEMTYQLQVSPDGMILVNNIGPIHVNGLTVDEASRKLKERLGEIYSGLDPQAESQKDTYMQLSLGQVRSIKVNVIGEADRPGSYTLPSLATVFNALYSSGGPTVNGSFRRIQVLRGDSVAATFDLYDLLINGDQSENIRLRSQDIIKISPYLNRVEVEGQVKREGIYETKGGETLAELLNYTGGFTGDAYTHRVKIVGNTTREKTISDVSRSNFDDYMVRNGDLVTVGKILDRFKNRVEIRGAVFRDGKYALADTTSVASLINRADGLRGDAFMNRGLIYREQDDYTLETIPFDVREVVSNPEENDIKLKRNDIVIISSIFDLRDDYFVEIEGPVQKPDRYKYAENMTLEDIIFRAGGLKRGATPYRIEVARRLVGKGEEKYDPSQIAEIHRFKVDENLRLNPKDAAFELQPFDKVYIRQAPNYQEQQDVEVSGQVKYPGTYSLASKGDRISDIIDRAGGLTPDAYVEGATLYRTITGIELNELTDDEELQGFYVADGDTLQRQVGQNNSKTITKIGISLQKILQEPGSSYDLFLEKGDSLYIPRQLQTVVVKGGVFYPRSVRYQRNMNYKDYITAAGGFTDLAKDNSAYIIYANGDVSRVKKFLFFKNFPDVKPGATLVVPEKPATAKLSPQERISILSAVTSTAALIATTIVQITR